MTNRTYRFRHYCMRDEQEDCYKILMLKFEEIEKILDKSLKDSRYKSIVMTELENTMMWINKALSREFEGEGSNESLSNVR